MAVELFDLLAQGQLHRVRLEEASDFFFAEEELVLDQRLHVCMAVDDGIKQLGKVCSILVTLVIRIKA